MGEILEPILKGMVIVGSRYINWSAVWEWVLMIGIIIFYVGGALLAAYLVYKVVSYPLKQMKRRNDLLEQMLREMKDKND